MPFFISRKNIQCSDSHWSINNIWDLGDSVFFLNFNAIQKDLKRDRIYLGTFTSVATSRPVWYLHSTIAIVSFFWPAHLFHARHIYLVRSNYLLIYNATRKNSSYIFFKKKLQYLRVQLFLLNYNVWHENQLFLQ